jgi:nickel/cobalt transporter (NiCoT) family protein
MSIISTNRASRKLFFAWVGIALLHVVGIAALALGGLVSSSLGVALGIGGTAYLLGLRHAFDADHIAAIDNTVRRLSAEKKDSSLVGLFFSLGHSTVVLAAGTAVALGFTFIAELLNDDSSALKSTGALIGGTVAGTFLLIIALVNVGILSRILRQVKQEKELTLQGQTAGEGEAPKGVLTTLLAPLFKNVDKDWKMYPLGLLFGLGFDTATSIALLALSGGAAILAGQTWIAIALPIIFMSGMALGDTIDSMLMSRAYNYSTSTSQKRNYFIVITSLSIIAALIVGLPILSENLSTLTGLQLAIPGIEFEYFGMVLAAGFIGIWLVALATSKLRNRS